jgi:hypothetical protein
MVIGLFALIVAGAFVLLAANPFAIRVSSSSSSTPERFSFATHCADTQHCTLTVTNDAQSHANLTVLMLGVTPQGAVIAPANANVSPGASQAFTVTFPNPTCQSQLTFSATFGDEPRNTIPADLPLQCATP